MARVIVNKKRVVAKAKKSGVNPGVRGTAKAKAKVRPQTVTRPRKQPKNPVAQAVKTARENVQAGTRGIGEFVSRAAREATGRVTRSSPISQSMKTGADANNPLKRILRGK